MRYRLEYLLFRIFGLIVTLLPLETASACSGAVWRLAAPLTKRHRRALAHLKIAYPELTDADRAGLAAEMWDTMGRVFAESFRLEEITRSGRVRFEDEALAHELLMRPGGYVACAAHQGNWELAASGLQLLGRRAAGVYQRLKNPYVDAAARRLREPLYPAGLFPKGRSAALAAMRVVKSGDVLTVMADLRENRGIRVPFFGRGAPSTPFPAMVAVTLDRPLIAAQVIREPGVRFRVRVREVEVARTGDREADIAITTANLQHVLEDYIRSRPSQWMWGHRRWG